MSTIETKLADLGLSLPPDWAARGRFLPYRRDGAIVYLSGQINEWGGAVTLEGPVPDTDDHVAAARKAAGGMIERPLRRPTKRQRRQIHRFRDGST